LIQRYFYEKFRLELIYWSLMAVVCMFLRNQLGGFSGLLIVAGALFAARFSREIHKPNSGIHYFMLPATQVEKIIVTFLLTTVYYFGMMVVAYIVGNLVGTWLWNLIGGLFLQIFHSDAQPFREFSLQWLLFKPIEGLDQMGGFTKTYLPLWSLFKAFLPMQALFTLGGIYFKRNQAFKTWLVFIASCFLLLLLVGVEFRLLVWDEIAFNRFSGQMEDAHGFFTPFIHTVRVFFYLLIPYLWTVSYFRLTEKEV
jgi:hypothetical protein